MYSIVSSSFVLKFVKTLKLTLVKIIWQGPFLLQRIKFEKSCPYVICTNPVLQLKFSIFSAFFSAVF